MNTLKMIRTFVFFDLETTGLIRGNVVPKITELSLVAVSRDAICESKESMPRVLHKLVLPLHPAKEIPKEAQRITNLSNRNLEGVQPFQCETYNLLVNFLQRLTMPVCFVAYNGNTFDYPILLWELQNINKALNEDILSIDMLHMIRHFFSEKTNFPGQPTTVPNISSKSFSSEYNNLLNDGYDSVLSIALDSVMNCSSDSEHETSKPEKLKPNERSSKTSPGRSESGSKTPRTSCYKKMQEINEKTPESQIKKSGNTNNFQGGTTARRRLEFTHGRPANFKLTSVCQHILGVSPENEHSAEGDCLTMLRCATQLGSYFTEWADCNAAPLINYARK